MDELTLREKLDAIEACERLIARYQEKVDFENRRLRVEEDEETVGYDFSSMDGDKLRYYKDLKKSLIDSLENDDVLRRAAESNSFSR